jgi:hypothetical protein
MFCTDIISLLIKLYHLNRFIFLWLSGKNYLLFSSHGLKLLPSLGVCPSVRPLQWTIEEISTFSNRSHLEWRAGLSDTILKGTHPRTIPARFDLIRFKGFRGEDLNVKVYDVRRTDAKWWQKSSPLKPLKQIKTNLAGMVLGWSPFNIVSDSPALQNELK